MSNRENPKNVEIINLTKTFLTKDKTIHAVKDVSFSVQPGEFVCLLGESGSGKTTLLRMLAGFEIPTEGKIVIGGKNVASLTPNKRDTALVFQNYALFPHMNVYDNIAYGLKIKRLPKAEINRRVQDILKLVKMDDFARRIPSQMSGGQQQRVSLARALIMNSSLLLLDEPLSNLDAKLRLHMRDEIKNIQKEIGITSIYVTHDQSEAMALADRVVLMKDGEIAQIGSPIEIYQRPNSIFAAKFIGRANILQGKILKKGSTSAVVSILDKEYVIPKRLDAFSVGTEIAVVARPESADISQNVHQGTVVKSVFMGESHEYIIDIAGYHIEISVSHPQGKAIQKKGETLMFGFQAETLHVIEAASSV